MTYRVVYDIASDPPFEPATALYAAGFMVVGAIWALVRKRQKRSPTTGYVLLGFGAVFAVVGVGLMSWDHARLVAKIERGEAQVVEGPVLRWSTERQRTARRDKHEYNTYESFYVGEGVWFGYHWELEQAGFHNQDRVPLRDGLQVRVTHVPGDFEGDPPRIVKLEIAR